MKRITRQLFALLMSFVVALGIVIGPGGMTAAALDATVDLSTLTANYTISESGSYDFSGTLADGYHIAVGSNIIGDVNITLSNVKIGIDQIPPQNRTVSALEIGSGTTVNLTLAGVNYLLGENAPGILVPYGATLNIDGAGTLSTKCATNSITQSAAGIGGARGGTCGTITINGGKLIKAIGYRNSSGIGSGYEGSGGSITINGGTVEASAGAIGGGAAIGSGFKATGDCSITINGGEVRASSIEASAAIGNGYGSTGAKVTITGGSVTAVTGGSGGAIGNGEGVVDHQSSCTVLISGGTVTATMDANIAKMVGAAGIGGGLRGNGCDVTITGGTVTAFGHTGIGPGAYGPSAGSCIVTGGSVKIKSINSAEQTAVCYDAASTPAYPVSLTVPGITTATAVSYSANSGSTVTSTTDTDGKLYLWLPAQTNADVSVTAGSNTFAFSGAVSSTGTNTLTTKLSSQKAITAFNFNGLTPAVLGNINEDGKTIELTVPYGTDLAALVPTITHTGTSISPNTGVAQNFSSPVTYTVTAEDGTPQPYIVSVTVSPPAVITVGTGGNYEILADALAAAPDGCTIRLLNDLHQSTGYLVSADKTITIDGNDHALFGTTTQTTYPIPLYLHGTGTVILKKLYLFGGPSTLDNEGLVVSEHVSVRGDHVYVEGGSAQTSYGLVNEGSGTVDVTRAVSKDGSSNYGVMNTGSGTVNILSAEGSGPSGIGVKNTGTGTVNVWSASGSIGGVRNESTGTVNAKAAECTSGNGVNNLGGGTVNVTQAYCTSGNAVSNSGGTVNAGTVTGSIQGAANTGIATAALTLNKGSGADCILASITVAAAGDTTVGSLPCVYKNGGYSRLWYTDAAKLTPASSTVTASTSLYSSFYNAEKISTAAISGVTIPVTGQTPVSSIADTAQYSASIAWSPSDAIFAANTAYTATITIAPKDGYTLAGVGANFFTVTGAAVTNGADSGIVTAVFSATAAVKTLVSVTAPATITGVANVAAKTAAALGLPSQVTLVTNNGNVQANVTWDVNSSSYNASSTTAQTFTVNGTVALPAGVLNTNSVSLTTTISVSVNAAPSGGAPSGGSSSTTPSTPASGTTATTTATAKTGTDGKAAASVTQSQLSDALDKAKAAAGTNGKPDVKIQIDGASGASSVGTTIPQASVQALVSGNTAALTISGPTGAVTFDAAALKIISGAASGDVTVTASKVDTSTLPDTAKQAVGSQPVYEFSVTSGGKTISQFGGSVTVSVPYTPTAGEDTNAIVIYYIGADGKLTMVPDARYDAATGTVVFTTTHFSTYAVGYNKMNFTDVSDTAWYSGAVTFLAARGITSGTTAESFSPDASLTRGQFITMLLRAYSISPDGAPTDNFFDAGNTYYTNYLVAAKLMGITSGIGENLFAPDRGITRQEMFTLLYSALKATGNLPQGKSGKTLADFSDATEIASWAKDAMMLLVETGTVSGSTGKLSPTSATTRAEMAQVLYSLLGK